MAEKVNTGGTKTFNWSNEELERIRHTDTDSTRDFKKALYEWEGKLAEKRAKRKKLMKILWIIIPVIAVLLIFFLLLRNLI